MAEILIKLEPANNPSDLLAWNRLHPVVVKPDGWVWGSAERPPKFLVIRITDMTVAEVEQYLETDWDFTAPNPIMLAIRKLKIDLDDVTTPNQVKNAISRAIQNGTILEVTKAQIVNFIKRTISG